MSTPVSNIDKVSELRSILESHIVGQKLPSWSCNCGACKSSAATAISVGPYSTEPDSGYDKWYMWRVKMREDDSNEDYNYTIGLNTFIELSFIESLFSDYWDLP